MNKCADITPYLQTAPTNAASLIMIMAHYSYQSLAWKYDSEDSVSELSCNAASSTYHRLGTLKQEIRQLEQRERVLQSNIKQLQEQLKETQASLSQRTMKATTLQNLLAPVSRLPNEMLLAIFEEAVSSPPPEKEMWVPINISHVCRRWRAIVVNSPRLWKHIWVIPRINLHLLEAYGARASGSGSLDVHFYNWRERKDFQRFDAALEFILPYSGRWRSLSISFMCDTKIQHLANKLKKESFPTLRHFSFRALRPGQTCIDLFSVNGDYPALKTFDAENFSLSGDLIGSRSKMLQVFSGLTSLTLRRYSNDARSLRIMIDSSVFRTLVNSIPGLTTLALHGQPLRFRIGPPTEGESTLVSMPHLQNLILHPGVLKPRYLQQTISNIHAPSLHHFELVFPDSKMSGQNIVELLFDAKTKKPRFPLVNTIVLHNATNSSTASSFVHAFPYVSDVTLGGVDVGFIPQVLRARIYDAFPYTYGCTYDPHTSYPYWHRLHSLVLRSTKPETLQVVREWMRVEMVRGHTPPKVTIQGTKVGQTNIDMRHSITCGEAHVYFGTSKRRLDECLVPDKVLGNLTSLTGVTTILNRLQSCEAMKLLRKIGNANFGISALYHAELDYLWLLLFGCLEKGADGPATRRLEKSPR
ncbi:hypothetical protein EDC04DRAFT_2604907 [Pisolithus marmoratus]|nr:hypothetical protein EDC04DRAFT_2604907 [Pisolithus marmoratus]